MKNSTKAEEEKQFWADFSKNIAFVIGYDDACEACLIFLKKYGIVDCVIKNTEGIKSDTNALLKHLLKHFETLEEYSKCVDMQRISRNEITVEAEAMSFFLLNANTVMSFEDNCEVCEYMFEAYESVPFWGIAKPHDYIKLMTTLVNYFHGKTEYKKCILLKNILDEVVYETKYAQKK